MLFSNSLFFLISFLYSVFGRMMRTSWYFWTMGASLESLLGLFGNVNGAMPSVTCYWCLWSRSPDSLLSLCWYCQWGRKVPPQAPCDWLVRGAINQIPHFVSADFAPVREENTSSSFLLSPVGVMIPDSLFHLAWTWFPPQTTWQHWQGHKEATLFSCNLSTITVDGVVKVPPWVICHYQVRGQESRLLVWSPV